MNQKALWWSGLESKICYTTKILDYTWQQKKPNPQYLPEIFIKVTVINFTATFEGLED